MIICTFLQAEPFPPVLKKHSHSQKASLELGRFRSQSFLFQLGLGFLLVVLRVQVLSKARGAHFLIKSFTDVGGTSRRDELLLLPYLTLSSSQVSDVFPPFWGALPVQAVLRFLLLPASLLAPGLERVGRAQAASIPLTLLPTMVVEIRLQTQR